jgi:dTDP-4-dehydrorhamnose reductase
MLGEAFYRHFKPQHDLRCSDLDLNEDWLSFLDFRDYNEYLSEVSSFGADALFHLGAHTSLEQCELNYNETYTTNTLAVENAVHIANRLDIPLLYISTAGIFDGAQESYDDWDEPNPLGHYARSKLAGERFVVSNCRRYLVCRAGWMMGGGPRKDKKFVQKVMSQIKAGSSELFVVDDKLGTPTYTIDFARNVDLLLGHELWGVYNMVCNGATGRLEVASHIVKTLGLENKVKVTPVPSEFFSKEYFAARPASERLISSKLNLRGLNIMRDWRVCLEEYLAEYYADYLK